ncbi:MAG: hypothetical protein R3Y63_13575 [Eubacteriales bacterium]
MSKIKRILTLVLVSVVLSVIYFSFTAKGFFETQVIPYGVVYYPFGILTLLLVLLPLTKSVPYFKNNHKFSIGQIFLISLTSLIFSTFLTKNLVGGFIAQNYEGGLGQFYRVGYTNLFQLPLYMEDCKYTDWILHEDEQGYFYYDKRGNRKEASGNVSFDVEDTET